MYLKIIRAVSALLLVISATVGVQNASQSTQAQVVPAVLMSFVDTTEPQQATESAEEATVAALPNEAIISPAPAPIALPTPTVQPTQAPAEITISVDPTQSKVKSREEKVAILQSYLQKYNSPMVDNAQDFVDAAEQYELDWRLVASIAGVESTYGKHILPGSYNPFGWGGGRIHFDSWRDAIYTVSKGISEKYVKDGLDTPYKMQTRYAPPSTTWGGKVDFFMQKIDSTTPSMASAQ